MVYLLIFSILNILIWHSAEGAEAVGVAAGVAAAQAAAQAAATA